MTFTHAEAATTLGVHPRSIGKAIKGYRDATGCEPPGRVGPNCVDDEFIDWYNSRPENRDYLRGHRGQRRPPPAEIERPPQCAHVPAVVTGLTPASRVPDTDDLWGRVTAMQQKDEQKTENRYAQEVLIPDGRPVLLVLLADIHLGGRHVDYMRAKHDAELIRDTDGVYAAILGDTIDNWIGEANIMAVQREQPIQHSEELALLDSWIGMMRDKLIAVVSGNHELRSYNHAGLDILQRALVGVTTLYDQQEIRFLLRLGEASWPWKLRHSWVKKSKLSPSHGLEHDARFNDGSWVFGVGAHYHTQTTFRMFVDAAHDNTVKLAINLGSYQRDSAYARKLNLPQSISSGSAGLMLWPSGAWQYWLDLEAATRFLAMERAR